MTFSILVKDAKAGALGAAAATGSLCVGGWVLRGDSRAGVSASQGASPSTMWGEDVLERMKAGEGAEDAVAAVTKADSGRDWRQLAALDLHGGAACHTGEHNTDWHGSLIAPGLVVSGNFLTGSQVLEVLRDQFLQADGTLAERLLSALSAAESSGGDTRGVQSAALLVVSDDAPPLTLRVDWAERPIDALRDLHVRSRSGSYADWLPCVPTRNNPEIGHD